MRKLKKGIMATLEKKCQTPMEKQKKIYKKLPIKNFIAKFNFESFN